LGVALLRERNAPKRPTPFLIRMVKAVRTFRISWELLDFWSRETRKNAGTRMTRLAAIDGGCRN